MLCYLFTPGQTPASRRFLPTIRTEKPATSSRRPQFGQPHDIPQSIVASQQQFATTPKFSFGSFNKTSSEADKSADLPSLASSSPFPSRNVSSRIALQYHEDIEETSLDYEDFLDVQQQQGLGTIDKLDRSEVAGDLVDSTATTPWKRRRLHPPDTTEEQIIISSSPIAGDSLPITPPLGPAASPSPPSTPLPRHVQLASSSTHPRFRLSLPTHSSPVSSSVKPSFILPKVPESPSTSVPSALLSPHRRSQKYAPGGLASTARDWIVEAGQNACQRRSDSVTSEEWPIRLRIDEVQLADGVGGRVTLMKEMAGNAQSQSGRNWLLIGSPKTGHGKSVDEIGIRRGAILAVGNPTWDVEVRGLDTWHVGLEWKVIPSSC